MTEAQEAKLRQLCDAYNVEFDAGQYLVFPADSWMMPGWAEGWVGGDPTTIFVGVSPTGESHS
jgi:hypothetical protein